MSEEQNDSINSLTLGRIATADELPGNERARHEHLVSLEFNHDGNGKYYYIEAPDVLAITLSSKTMAIETNHNSPAVSRAMVSIAASRGWANYVTKGDDVFYKNIETASDNAAAEREKLLSESAVHTVKPTIAGPIETLRAQAKSMKQPDNVMEPENTNDNPDDGQTLRRAALVRSVNEQYRVAGTKYYFKDQAGAVNQLAFKDNGAKLSTSLNTERVTKSLVDLAESKGWTEINVSGHKEFKRQVWRAATDRGIEVNGYTPDENDLTTVSDKALNNSIEQTPVKQASKVASQSRDLSGVLVEHGEAPYQNKPDNKDSYYVTVNTGENQRTVWGVDLANAISDSDAQPGDYVELRKTDTTPVEVKDKNGQVVQSVRNTWAIKRDEKREVITALAAAVIAQNVPNESDRQRIAEGIQARIDTHDGPLPQVQIYDNNATRPVTVEPAQAKTKAPELIR